MFREGYSTDKCYSPREGYTVVVKNPAMPKFPRANFATSTNTYSVWNRISAATFVVSRHVSDRTAEVTPPCNDHRAAVVRLALERSFSVAGQTFDMAETTVRDLVRRHRSGEPYGGKKRPRPQNLSTEVEKAVDNAVKRLRHVGGTVQASTIQGLATAKNAELLSDDFRPGDPVSKRTVQRSVSGPQFGLLQ
jgi:hypothetical protein